LGTRRKQQRVIDDLPIEEKCYISLKNGSSLLARSNQFYWSSQDKIVQALLSEALNIQEETKAPILQQDLEE